MTKTATAEKTPAGAPPNVNKTVPASKDKHFAEDQEQIGRNGGFAPPPNGHTRIVNTNPNDVQDMTLGKNEEIVEVRLAKDYRPRGYYQYLGTDGVWTEPASTDGGDNGAAHQVKAGGDIRVPKSEAKQMVADGIGYNGKPIE